MHDNHDRSLYNNADWTNNPGLSIDSVAHFCPIDLVTQMNVPEIEPASYVHSHTHTHIYIYNSYRLTGQVELIAM